MDDSSGYLAFVWSPTGYQLREEQGEPPDVGDTVEADGRTWRVVKVAPSPLPRDKRTCAYLQA
jgi:hypothetical protein